MHFTRAMFKFLKQFEYYAKFPPTPVTLQGLIDFGMNNENSKRLFSLFVSFDSR